ncbi:hypothetical protein HOLleu_27502 [Holothuria leucospilota]|uniref:Uncharacterized protein n=1 Tax=Holothuria leucospilota TaxID=206669 RepID=A0A9Q1H3J4_HOLLE|nr:hypothetical protein HOLleu_27502 [Holothuria leucospilota]
MSIMAPPENRPKRRTKYSDEYQKKYPFIRACSSSVQDNLYKFHCTSCNVNVSCAHGGITDVKDHVSSAKHIAAHRNSQRNSRIDAMFRKRSSSGDVDPTIAVETKMVMLLIQHNTFFNISDHLTPLIRNEFKGSTVAESFSCSRTKTAAIVNCLGDHFFEKLKTDMQNQPYSLMLDASNDTGLQKMFPVTVRIYDINFRRIMTKFLDINLLEG